MPPEENIRAILVCRGTDNKIYVCNNRRREVYPGTDHAPIAEIKRYWSDFMEAILISTGKWPAPLTLGCRPNEGEGDAGSLLPRLRVDTMSEDTCAPT
jgi:hypothetical protein